MNKIQSLVVVLVLLWECMCYQSFNSYKNLERELLELDESDVSELNDIVLGNCYRRYNGANRLGIFLSQPYFFQDD